VNGNGVGGNLVTGTEMICSIDVDCVYTTSLLSPDTNYYLSATVTYDPNESGVAPIPSYEIFNETFKTEMKPPDFTAINVTFNVPTREILITTDLANNGATPGMPFYTQYFLEIKDKDGNIVPG
jgi:hypothetical protein